MVAAAGTPRKRMLLVEPHSLFRSTLANVARQLASVDIHETSSLEAARAALETERFDGLMLNVGEDLGGLDVLQRLREGGTINPRDLPTALLAEGLDPAAVDRVRELHPKRLLLMPFKVRTALEVIDLLMSSGSVDQGAPFMRG
ncbi:hypothetical protein ACFJGW_10725 [Burkholderiaceae bacterium UC74_6]